MNNCAIKVAGLGKTYRRVARRQPYRTLRDSLANAASWPLRRFGRGTDSNASDLFHALNDISFEVNWGEVVGIIGRNGAGKSTLLKILSRITEPSAGAADIYGRVGGLLEVGSGFHGELSGRENIYLQGAILGMRRREIHRKFDEIVAFAEVADFIDTPVKHYSSGMYLRLAFAVAAHMESDILLVDEILAVGDAAFQKKCLGKMTDVAERGRTVLFVSHNLGVLSNLCSRAILLSHGQKIADGPSHEVIKRYLQEGLDQSGERVWDTPATAPGSDIARLHSVRIISNGQTTAEVAIDQPVQIEITFWNLRPGSQLSTSIHLLDKLGVEVLASANFPSASLAPDPWFGKPFPAGLFKAVCTLPANFLNDGLYSLNVLVLNRVRVQEVFARDVIRFNVHDTGAMRVEFGGRWIGVIRPRLAWHTIHEDEQHRSSVQSLAATKV